MLHYEGKRPSRRRYHGRCRYRHLVPLLETMSKAHFWVSARGAVFGGAMGYMGYKDKEEKARLAKFGTKKGDDAKVPSLTSPEVRRVWVPERIDGQKFIEGHYMYLIERNSVWSR